MGTRLSNPEWSAFQRNNLFDQMTGHEMEGNIIQCLQMLRNSCRRVILAVCLWLHEWYDITLYDALCYSKAVFMLICLNTIDTLWLWKVYLPIIKTMFKVRRHIGEAPFFLPGSESDPSQCGSVRSGAGPTQDTSNLTWWSISKIKCLNADLYTGRLMAGTYSHHQGKWSEPNLYEVMFQPLIFQGVLIRTSGF